VETEWPNGDLAKDGHSEVNQLFWELSRFGLTYWKTADQYTFRIFLSGSDLLHTGNKFQHNRRATRKGEAVVPLHPSLSHCTISRSCSIPYTLFSPPCLQIKVNLGNPLGPGTHRSAVGDLRAQGRSWGWISPHALVTSLFAKRHKYFFNVVISSSKKSQTFFANWLNQ